MKKNDLLLILGFLAAALLLYGIYHVFFAQDGANVIVTVDGTEYAVLSLTDSTVLKITGVNGENTLVIENGAAYISDADCPDQLCTFHKPISKNGESIICMPNRIVIKVVKATSAADLDAIAN